MATEETLAFVDKILRTTRFFNTIVLSGVILFVPIVYVALPSVEGGAEEKSGIPILKLLVAIVTIAAPLMCLFAPHRVAAMARRRVVDQTWRDEPEELTDSSIPNPQTEEQYFATTFLWTRVAQSVLLGLPAFFASVVYMFHRERWLLAIAGVMIFLLITRYPRRHQVLAWIEQQEALIPAQESRTG